jgi:hypothetical protein
MYFQPFTGVLFGADAAEKLIQVVRDSHGRLLFKGMWCEVKACPLPY